MNLAAVIFDMDGLLLDSERLALAAFVETCAHFGLGDETAVFMKCIGTNQELGEQVLREGLQGKADPLAFGRLWDSKYLASTSECAVPLKSGAAELLRVQPANCLALEDSENGVRSALGAGMTVIQIPDLVQPSDAMRKLGHTVLESLHDVRGWYSGMRAD